MLVRNAISIVREACKGDIRYQERVLGAWPGPRRRRLTQNGEIYVVRPIRETREGDRYLLPPRGARHVRGNIGIVEVKKHITALLPAARKGHKHIVGGQPLDLEDEICVILGETRLEIGQCQQRQLDEKSITGRYSKHRV